MSRARTGPLAGVRRFFKKRERVEETSTAQASAEPESRTRKDDESQPDLVPDIYTQPDPKQNLTKKIDWRGMFKMYQANRYYNYPNVRQQFTPDPKQGYGLAVFNVNSRHWFHNRPETVAPIFLKDRVIYQFRGREDVKNWYCASDHMYNGHSWCELTNSKNGKTINFRGYINNELPRDRRPLPGPVGYKSFCYMQTKPWFDGKPGYLSWEEFTNLKIRFRGDGRKYHICFHSDFSNFDSTYSLFRASLQTNGGPQWQTISIPFVKFLATNEFHLDLDQEAACANRRVEAGPLCYIDYLRVILYDTEPGPFSFEIDYIAVEKDKKEELLAGYTGRVYHKWHRERTADILNPYVSNTTGIGRFADKMYPHKRRVPKEAYYAPVSKDT